MQLLYVALALIVVGIGGWFAGSMYGAKDCKAGIQVHNAKVETAKAKDDAKREVRSANRAAERARDAAIAGPIQEEVQNDVRQNPAPSECVSPPQRLRRINELIDQANAPAGVHPGRPKTEAALDGGAGRIRALGDRHDAEVHGAP
jgi:hypothetical protein